MKNFTYEIIKKLHFIAISSFIALFLYQCLSIASSYSLANDEGKHLLTGLLHLEHHKCCEGVDNTPMTAYMALPLLFFENNRNNENDIKIINIHNSANELLFSYDDPLKILFIARITSVFAGIILIFFSFLVSKYLFGPLSGLLTVIILTLDPNIISHYSLVSTDALLSTSVVIFLYIFLLFHDYPSFIRSLLLGTALGIAILSKFTALILIPAFVFFMLVFGGKKKVGIIKYLFFFFLIGSSAFLIIWLGYGAHFSFVYPFFKLPGFYEGYLQAKAYATNGMVSFLNGEIGYGWPYYFIEALVLKTPIPILIFWILSICTLFYKFNPKKESDAFLPLMLSGLFFAGALLSSLNIGIRHILMVYPLMAISCGVLVPLIKSASKTIYKYSILIVVCLLSMWGAIENISVYPHHLSYVNQIGGGPVNGIKYLGDSNIDWGQDLGFLKEVMEEKGIKEVILGYFGNTDPFFYNIKYQYLPLMIYGNGKTYVVSPEREIIAISTNNLQGIYDRRLDYSWLRYKKPFAMAGYSIYLYDITGDEKAHLELAKTYSIFGLKSLSLKEEKKASELMKNKKPDFFQK